MMDEESIEFCGQPFGPRVWFYQRACTKAELEQQKQLAVDVAIRRGYGVMGARADIGRVNTIWRPGLRKLCKQVRKGNIDIVLVPKLSCLDTKWYKVCCVLRLLQRHNVALYTIERNLRMELSLHGLDCAI